MRSRLRLRALNKEEERVIRKLAHSRTPSARLLQRSQTIELAKPYQSWNFERLAAYVHEQLGIQMKKTRIFEILQEEGLRWRKQETWFGERLDPEFAQKRGPSSGSAKSHQPTASS